MGTTMAVLSSDPTVQLRLEELELIKGETHISEGQSRIARQVALLSHLEAGGHDTQQAERLITVMQQTLVEWERHLVLIRHRIEMLRQEIDQTPPGR